MKSLRWAIALWLADKDNRETLIVTFGLLALSAVVFNPWEILA